MVVDTSMDIVAVLRQEPGPRLSKRTRARVLDIGPTAVAQLVSYLEEQLPEVSADRCAHVAFDFAVELLGELKAIDAIPLLGQILDATDPLTRTHEACTDALGSMGGDGVTPLLEVYARSEHVETRRSLRYTFVDLGVRDARILELLLDGLSDDPDHAAGLLGDYGDPAALPALEAVLDRYEIGTHGEGPFADHVIIELVAAIELLGGTVSAAGLVKHRRVVTRGRAQTQPLRDAITHRAHNPPRIVPVASPSGSRPPRSAAKLGRNERCWCGSGKKYKHCHLATTSRAGRN